METFVDRLSVRRRRPMALRKSMRSGNEQEDPFERMEKALSEMNQALARLQVSDDSLIETASLIEYQTQAEDILERLRTAVLESKSSPSPSSED